jgi:hypothetical protein
MTNQTISRIRQWVFAIAAAALTFAAGTSFAQSGPFQYYAVTPCRILDTRQPAGPYGGPALGGAETRSFLTRGVCGIPNSARALTLNVTVTQATNRSHLILWPAGTPRPTVSTINFNSTDPALANGAIVPISTSNPDLSVFNYQGNVHVILDVTGYFQ